MPKATFKRNPRLAAWLDSKPAMQCFFQKTDQQLQLTAYVTRDGHALIIREWLDTDGAFDIYIPACSDNDITKTLDAVDVYLNS